MKKPNNPEDHIVDVGRRNFLKGMLISGMAAALSGLALPARVLAAPETSRERELYEPRGLAWAEDGALYVADAGNYCVRVFDGNGKLTGTIGAPGAGKGELNYPCDLVLSGDDLFVVDTNNGRLCRFSRKTGRFIQTIGSLGGSSDRLFTPGGMDASREHFFVANTRSHCCQVWDRNTGRATAAIGILGDEPAKLAKGDRDIRLRLPTAVAYDSERRMIFIADSKHGRVVVTDPAGSYITEWNGADTGAKLLRPQDLCLYGGELFVADSGNKRILRIAIDTGKARELTGNWNEPVGIDVMNGRLAVSDWHADPDQRKVMTVQLPGQAG